MSVCPRCAVKQAALCLAVGRLLVPLDLGVRGKEEGGSHAAAAAQVSAMTQAAIANWDGRADACAAGDMRRAPKRKLPSRKSPFLPGLWLLQRAYRLRPWRCRGDVGGGGNIRLSQLGLVPQVRPITLWCRRPWGCRWVSTAKHRFGRFERGRVPNYPRRSRGLGTSNSETRGRSTPIRGCRSAKS